MGSIKNMERVTKNEIAEEIAKRKRDRELEDMLRLSEKSGSVAPRDISLDWMYKEIVGSRKQPYINQTLMPTPTTEELKKSNKVTENDFRNYRSGQIMQNSRKQRRSYSIIQSVREREKYMVVKYKISKRF